MTSYRITQEFHVMPEGNYQGKRIQEIEFFYAIRRGDESLVFRAETVGYADQLLAGLVHQERLRLAA